MPGDTILNPENEAYDNAVKMAAKTSGERDAYLKEAEDVLMENMVIARSTIPPIPRSLTTARFPAPAAPRSASGTSSTIR
ncbi:MAG: hypothetical protein ACLSUM_00705 [Dysosmobacter welbionis]